MLSTSKSGREYYDGAFGHDEADITMVSCAIQAASYRKYVIRMISDDRHRCVCLTGLLSTKSSITVQVRDGEMEWNSTIDINANCTELGPKCLQLLSVHALSGCNTTFRAKARQEQATLCCLETFQDYTVSLVRKAFQKHS